MIRDLSIGAVNVCSFPGAYIKPEWARAHPARAADALANGVNAAGPSVRGVFRILRSATLLANHPDTVVRKWSLGYFVAALEFARRVGVAGPAILPGMQFVGFEPDAYQLQEWLDCRRVDVGLGVQRADFQARAD